MKPTVLVVDDEEQVRNSIVQWLELGGLAVDSAANVQEALGAVRRHMPYVVLSDFKMPQKSGMDLLQEVHKIDPDVPVVLLTAHGDVQLAVAAMRAGAYDFLQKPYVPDHLTAVINRAIEQRKLKLQLRDLSDRVAARDGLEARLIGTSAAMIRLRDMIAELAVHNRDVIVVGETGTGKEVVARALHDMGPRARAPFVAVNCAAVPMELFESELFGHEAGAFTGSRGAREGKFEFANGGTVLLDEIESMPLILQSKLLRVLQERSIERVGSNKTIPIDIRVIAATKCNLEAESRAGRFRADLYYRLMGAEIPIPPLRTREGDVLLLFEHFAAQAAAIAGTKARPLSAADIEVLLMHQWPGNVRELKAIAERYGLGLKAAGLTVQDILRHAEPSQAPAGHALADRVAAYERRLIEAALRDHGGSIAAVIDTLSIPRRTLNEKMAKYGLLRPGRAGPPSEDT